MTGADSFCACSDHSDYSCGEIGSYINDRVPLALVLVAGAATTGAFWKWGPRQEAKWRALGLTLVAAATLAGLYVMAASIPTAHRGGCSCLPAQCHCPRLITSGCVWCSLVVSPTLMRPDTISCTSLEGKCYFTLPVDNLPSGCKLHAPTLVVHSGGEHMIVSTGDTEIVVQLPINNGSTTISYAHSFTSFSSFTFFFLSPISLSLSLSANAALFLLERIAVLSLRSVAQCAFGILCVVPVVVVLLPNRA